MGARYLGSIPNAHIRDYQRKRVYDAEEQCMFWHDNPEISQTKAEQLINSISTWAEIKQPILYTGNKRTIPINIRKRLAKYIAYATPTYEKTKIRQKMHAQYYVSCHWTETEIKSKVLHLLGKNNEP